MTTSIVLTKLLNQASDHFTSYSMGYDDDRSLLYHERALECQAALEIYDFDEPVLPGDVVTILHQYAASLSSHGFNCQSKRVLKIITQ